MLIGDAAACVNPLNARASTTAWKPGELLGSGDPFFRLARAFSIARRLPWLLTVPWFLPTGGPIAIRSLRLM